MIIRLDESISIEQLEKVGNKGKHLIQMRKQGFRIPDGMILDSDEYETALKVGGIDEKIKNLLEDLHPENVEETVQKISSLFDVASIEEKKKKELRERLDPKECYAVRSSGTLEDKGNLSFAGLYDTFLNVQGIEQVEKAILDCYRSVFSKEILLYVLHHNMDFSKLKMPVIIQQMVAADCSGVVFTINPVTGNDKEMVIEMIGGLGDRLVSGRVNPEQYFYDWYEGSYRFGKENRILDEKTLHQITPIFLAIQKFFGHPCDIEFAMKNGKLYILQSRPITKVRYSGITELWSTADFKDGGVSATVCTPYMWSLYEYIWEYTLRKFVLDSKILGQKDCDRQLGKMFYGRPYWNLSFVKQAMSKIPGYRERDFDSIYGIRITYQGEGHRTGITVSSLLHVAKIALAQRKILKERNQSAESHKEALLQKYQEYKSLYEEGWAREQTEKIWYRLTKEDYLKSESIYFWQIFINTIHQSLHKDSLMKYMNHSQYLILLSGINDISHLRPFYEMWDTSRRIRQDAKAYEYWQQTDVKQMQKDLDGGQHLLTEVKRFLDRYGYHSDKELDVNYPCYEEDVIGVLKMFKDTLAMDDSCEPTQDQYRQKENYDQQLKRIASTVSQRKYSKIKRKIENMREMLWWREEFRDISTRFYYMIRRYTMKLADYYVEQGILATAEDIWMLKIADLWKYIEGRSSIDQLRKTILQNKNYYDSFRHYMSDNEIGSIFSQQENETPEKTGLPQGLCGLGCNSGKVTATARVVRSMKEMDRLQEGDILVTKYTDTGWTCKFAVLSGIVTEYGGILCHAAIVSREYGIPCIVAAKGVMETIRDGSRIMIDGETGAIRLMEE